jgi:hypothetical protein
VPLQTPVAPASFGRSRESGILVAGDHLIVALPGAELPDAVSELLTMAEGRRSPLEAAASLLIARLHRRSDDYDATRELCAVSAALSRIGWAMPPAPARRRRWTWG